MKSFQLENNPHILCIVIKEDNITLYYKGWEALMDLLDFEGLPTSLNCVSDHGVKAPKEKYHAGIDQSYTDDEHLHYERTDEGKLKLEDIKDFLNYLINQKKFLTEQEKNNIIDNLKLQPSSGVSETKFFSNSSAASTTTSVGATSSSVSDSAASSATSASSASSASDTSSETKSNSQKRKIEPTDTPPVKRHRSK